MKVYKLEVLIMDFDELGEEGIKQELESARFPNDCLSPVVMSIKTKDIGPWEDEHPLNGRDTQRAEYERLFND